MCRGLLMVDKGKTHGTATVPWLPAEQHLWLTLPELPPKTVVHISDEMNKALLLRAVDSIIPSIEIGDEHATEVPQYILDGAGLAPFAIHECHVLQVSEYPDVSIFVSDVSLNLCLP